MTSDYVGLLFLSSKNAGPAPRPVKTLVSYQRLHDVCYTTPQELVLPLTLGSLARADTKGNLVIYPGTYTLSLDTTGELPFAFELTGTEQIIDTLPTPAATYSATVPVHTEPPSRQAYS